jgi:hypothetical protein
MAIRQILSVSDIFSALGGNAELARAIGVGPSTASEMKRRGRIPAEHWQALIRAARAKGVVEIDAETLVRLHARNDSLQASGDPAAAAPDGVEVRTGPADRNGGHFSRFKRLRRSHFASADEIAAHVGALRQEWDRR